MALTPLPLPSRAARLAVLLVSAATLPTWAQDAQAPEADAPTLPSVQVQATNPESPPHPATHTVEGEALERATNLADIVRQQPLVSAPGLATGGSRNRSGFDRGGAAGYNIRGVEGNRIGMDIDGVELPEAVLRPYAGRSAGVTTGIGRDFIDPAMFAGVDITSGSGPRTGSPFASLGGSVGFRTKSARDYLSGPGQHLSAKIGHSGHDRAWHESATLATRTPQRDGLVAISRRDGHAARNHSGTVQAFPDDWHSNALLLKGGVDLGGTQRLVLSLDGYWRKNRTRFDGWDSDGANITEQSRQTNDTRRHTVQLQHLHEGTGGAPQLDTRLYWQGTETEDITHSTQLSDNSGARSVSGSRTRSLGFSSALGWQLGRHTWGAALAGSSQNTQRPWDVANLMPPQPDSSTRRWSAFVQDEITWGRLSTTPALHAERTQIRPRRLENFASGALSAQDIAAFYGGTHSHSAIHPSLHARYLIRPGWSAWGQWRRSSRTPAIGEIFGSWNMNNIYAGQGRQYALVGNPDIGPEKSDALELGLQGQPARGVALKASVFHTRYRDFIGYTRYTRALHPQRFAQVPGHIGIIYQAENRDRARIQGLEASARLEHGQWSPTLRGLYSTWAFGISQGHSKSHYAGDKNVPLDSVLPRKALVTLGWDEPQRRWGASLGAAFTAGKQAVDTRRNSFSNNAGASLEDSDVPLFRVPGHAVFDLHAWWQWSNLARLGLAVHNLTDKRHWDYASARNLQPDVARDRRDIELYTRPGRSLALWVHVEL